MLLLMMMMMMWRMIRETMNERMPKTGGLQSNYPQGSSKYLPIHTHIFTLGGENEDNNDGGDKKKPTQQTHIYIITLTIKLRDKDDEW